MCRSFRVFLVLSLLFVVPTLQGQAPQTPPAEPLRTAEDRTIDVEHIRLDLKVDLPKKVVDSRATLRFRSIRPINNISLDAVDFEVKQVNVRTDEKEKPAKFNHDGKKLVIDLGGEWPAGKDGAVSVAYRVRDPKAGLYFFGPTESEPNTPLTVWSQGQAISNRYWIPCLDHPDERQTSEMVVTVADGFEALSNGSLMERKTNPDKTVTFHWKQEKPHVAYLITLAVGQYDIVNEEWEKIPVQYYVPKGQKKEDVARTFGRTREMLTFFSKRFGVQYPWEKYAQVVVEQFTHGGMENTSATTLTDRVMHDARAIVDSSPDNLIAHELGHQWWGDLITCRDWAHTWLNEGFATFSEAIWVEHAEGPDEFAYNMLHKKRAAVSGGKERPIVDRRYSNPGMMFDNRAYPKGAWVLHMLRRQLGEELFWKCIQRYGNEHKFKCVETADFRRTLERETGRNLERFFYDWTERPGHPVLEIATEYLPETKQARIHIKQAQEAEAFHFPLKIVIQDGGEQPRVFQQEITEKNQTFFFPLAGQPESVSIDPDQSLLAEIKETKSRELWLKQLSAGDLAGRIRAAEYFGSSRKPQDREVLAKALKEEKFWGVQAEIAAALGEAGGEVSRDALLEGLKSAHPKVRRACADQLGKFAPDAKVAEALKAVLAKGDQSYFVEAAALSSYAKMRQNDTAAVLLPWLTKPSHGEVIRAAALNGLGNSKDGAVADTLLVWTKRGKSRFCRSAAMQSLAQLAQTADLKEEQKQQIATAISAYLEGETPPIRRAAATALRDLGRPASNALTVLESLAQNDPDESVRDQAKKTIEQLRNNAPAATELSRLREEIDRLKRGQNTLEERLNKYDKVERK